MGINTDVEIDCLASYKEIIDEVPQFPTTCFSKSPIVSPMWAHYAREHTGFVLEFDVEELKLHFANCLIRDVVYKNEANKDLEDLLLRVIRIKKPRYASWLMDMTFSEAYFSKYTDWSYEQESRFVDRNKLTEDIEGNQILFIPSSCVTSIITGSKFPSKKHDIIFEKAAEHNLAWYKLNIGKSYPVPYMTTQSNNVFIFKHGSIDEAEQVCESCKEPLVKESNLCPWCSITDAHKYEAAMGNPLRILDRYGLLEKYFEGINKIKK